MVEKLSDEERSLRIPADDPDLKYRVVAVFCYFAVLVIIGLPVWWYTTRVYRAALPLDEMHSLDEFHLFGSNVSIDRGENSNIPMSLEYDVLITIVDPEPYNIKLILDGSTIEKQLQPLLSNLSSFAKFYVKSQWISLVDILPTIKRHSNKIDAASKGTILTEQELPLIITPLEKKMWSHLSPRPSINLVVYHSGCKLAPIIITDTTGQIVDSNAFTSATWGGILIINPTTKDCNDGYFEPDTSWIGAVFRSQIRSLFGLKMDDESLETFQLNRIKRMIQSSRQTLKSLALLLLQIPSIVISDTVADTIRESLQQAKTAEKLLLANSRRNLVDALEAAKIAYKNAEAAFGDPSLLALLYFPDDQKYAVYIPLFLPVMIPVLMSIITIKKWMRIKSSSDAHLKVT